MANPYGPRGAPAVGNGLPGLPQRVTTIGTDPAGAPLQALLVRADTVFLTPNWATYARVTAQGRGGKGLTSSSATGAHGGAGGGLSASLVEPVSPGTPVEITFGLLATAANFLNYQLRGGNGGDATSTAGGAPGVGSGGAINFNGGAGATTTTSGAGGGGGGAAGRGGNGEPGGVVSLFSGGNSGPGDSFITGGGAGGAGQSNGGFNGYGALSRTDASPLSAVVVGKSTATVGVTPVTSCDGGDGGGGSGGAVGGASNTPGAGWVLIELW